MEWFDKDSFKYQAKIVVDHHRGKLHSLTVEKILRKLGIKIYSYGINIRRSDRTNIIQALKLEILKKMPNQMVILYLERDKERIRHLLRHGYLCKEDFNISVSKGKINIVIMEEESRSFIVLRGEIIGNRVVIDI